MKKIASKWIALFLVMSAILSMLPMTLAADNALAADSFTFTVGKGTKFDYIGLPEKIYADKKVIASVSWNEGSYNAQKEGTYTLSGTAKLSSGSSQAVTAYVTVKDCGFRLPPMTELIETRSSRRRSYSQFEGHKKIACTPLFDGDLKLEDYTWIYRWYKTSAPGVAGVLFTNEKDCTIDKTVPGQYYYCKVTGTKDGVSTTLTSRYVYVSAQSNEQLMSYRLTSSVDEVIAGKDFMLTGSAALRRLNGSFEQFYYSGVDDYITHFEFSSKTPGVSFSSDEVVAPRGIATVTVHTSESVSALDKIDLSVHVQSVSTSKIYYENLVINDDVTITLDVVKEPEERSLSDVSNQWYADGVRNMLSNGYMCCEQPNKFGAETLITRHELVSTLYRMDGFKDVTDIKNYFLDVSADVPYVNAVLWAASNGVIAGKTKTLFAPDDPVTRQEFATILYRYAKSPSYGGGTIGQFSDANRVSEYAKDAMRWCVFQNILTGSAGKLEPQGYCTRAQIATILTRYLYLYG